MPSTNSAYSILLASLLASSVSQIDRRLGELCREQSKEIQQLAIEFLSGPISPAAFLQFERSLQRLLREMGRKTVQFTCNACEPESAEEAPHDVTYEAGGYRRMNEKTRNRTVDTLFGKITLWRRGYRFWHRGVKEANIFPLELILGVVHGATPALAGEIGRMMAESGATQQGVLEHARRQFAVSLSVKRLRQLVESVSESMERFRQHGQLRKLQKLLEQAHTSPGRYKPVLSVGRDGISMPIERGGGYQQGAVATVAVYDRRGKRLGTVYLASTPESKQLRLTHQLTTLIKECLDQWCNEQGMPLPRLCYVTDAGDTECQYYRNVLCRLRDPRGNGKFLHWYRIIDYYHTTEKITIMAEALFGQGREASAWSRKMRKLLLKPNGVSRVLHSAAALRGIRGMDANRQDDFERAYNYLRQRTKHMRYADFKRLRLPIGSGVTEAACKTVFTQRLKLSGMGWQHHGAQVILTLRVVLLSGIWDEVYEAVIRARNPENLKPYFTQRPRQHKIAA
jgi:hypothetical protein